MQAWMFASICKLAALKWLGLYKGFHYNREWGIGERNFLIGKTRMHKQEYETLFSLREEVKTVYKRRGSTTFLKFAKEFQSTSLRLQIFCSTVFKGRYVWVAANNSNNKQQK
jgi:hypothetical protein